VEAGVAVVEVGSGGLADGEGAQHHGGRVTHDDVGWCCVVAGKRVGWCGDRKVVQRQVVKGNECGGNESGVKE
jgi:hypothetical protein